MDRTTQTGISMTQGRTVPPRSKEVAAVVIGEERRVTEHGKDDGDECFMTNLFRHCLVGSKSNKGKQKRNLLQIVSPREYTDKVVVDVGAEDDQQQQQQQGSTTLRGGKRSQQDDSNNSNNDHEDIEDDTPRSDAGTGRDELVDSMRISPTKVDLRIKLPLSQEQAWEELEDELLVLLNGRSDQLDHFKRLHKQGLSDCNLLRSIAFLASRPKSKTEQQQHENENEHENEQEKEEDSTTYHEHISAIASFLSVGRAKRELKLAVVGTIMSCRSPPEASWQVKEVVIEGTLDFLVKRKGEWEFMEHSETVLIWELRAMCLNLLDKERERVARVADTSDTAVVMISTGAKLVKAGMALSVPVIEDHIETAGKQVKGWVKTDEYPLMMDRNAVVAMTYSGAVKRASEGARESTRKAVVGVCDVSSRGIQIVADKIEQQNISESMSPESIEVLKAAGKVGLATLGAAALVGEAMVETSRAVVQKTANVTADVVQHKYGTSAGQVVTDAGETANNILKTIGNVAMLEGKVIAKSVAKTACKDHVDNEASKAIDSIHLLEDQATRMMRMTIENVGKKELPTCVPNAINNDDEERNADMVVQESASTNIGNDQNDTVSTDLSKLKTNEDENAEKELKSTGSTATTTTTTTTISDEELSESVPISPQPQNPQDNEMDQSAEKVMMKSHQEQMTKEQDKDITTQPKKVSETQEVSRSVISTLPLPMTKKIRAGDEDDDTKENTQASSSDKQDETSNQIKDTIKTESKDVKSKSKSKSKSTEMGGESTTTEKKKTKKKESKANPTGGDEEKQPKKKKSQGTATASSTKKKSKVKSKTNDGTTSKSKSKKSGLAAVPKQQQQQQTDVIPAVPARHSFGNEGGKGKRSSNSSGHERRESTSSHASVASTSSATTAGLSRRSSLVRQGSVSSVSSNHSDSSSLSAVSTSVRIGRRGSGPNRRKLERRSSRRSLESKRTPLRPDMQQPLERRSSRRSLESKRTRPVLHPDMNLERQSSRRSLEPKTQTTTTTTTPPTKKTIITKSPSTTPKIPERKLERRSSRRSIESKRSRRNLVSPRQEQQQHIPPVPDIEAGKENDAKRSSLSSSSSSLGTNQQHLVNQSTEFAVQV